MSILADAQDQSATNAHADTSAITPGSTSQTPQGNSDTSNRAPTAVTVVSATPMQPNTASDTMLYINITTAAAFKLEMGPTSSVATTLNASQSNALGLVTVRVPKGWYIKITGTVTNYSIVQIPV